MSFNMRAPLKFSNVDTKEKFDDAADFAGSFQHIIDDKSALPIITVQREDKKIGYFHILAHPVVSFAFHTDPAICSPRDFKEMVEAVRNWRCLNSMSQQFPNGACFLHLPEHPIIPRESIEKMGFVDRNIKFWQFTG